LVVVVVVVLAAVPLSLVVAVVEVVAFGSAIGVVAVVSVVVVVLVSGVDTGGVVTGGTVVPGVETGGTLVCGVDTGGTVCAVAMPDVPAINAPARMANFMKIFSWSHDGPKWEDSCREMGPATDTRHPRIPTTDRQLSGIND